MDKYNVIFYYMLVLISNVYSHPSLQDKSCGCRCRTIQIVSETISNNNILEYEDRPDIDFESRNSISQEKWEKEWLEIINKNRTTFNGEKFESNVVDMNFTNLWKPYKNLSRNTNLNFKDLLGSYEILDCPSVTTLGKITRFPIYYKILPDGKKAYLHKNRFGNVWQVSPHTKGAYQKLLKYQYTIEYKNDRNELKNETSIPVVLKSEAWMYGTCSSTCPGNCTGLALKGCQNKLDGAGEGKCESDAREAAWYYIQKSFNPGKDDETYRDLTLKTVCKEDYEESIKKQYSKCRTDYSGTKTDNNKPCEFPFKHDGILHNECIVDKSRSESPWCATKVGRKKKPLRGKWGNCNIDTCQSLNFDATNSLFKGGCPKGFIQHKRRCYGFFVNRYSRTTWSNAQKKCRSFNGGDLVSILTKSENEFIAKKVIEINPDLKDKDYYYPWIGLHIKKRRNKNPEAISFDCPRCRWSDRTEYTEHILNEWALNEPSIFKGKDHVSENCVHIYPDGKWNNVLCEETRGFVCAGPIPKEVDFCTSNPCQNGGTCDNNLDGTDYECVCDGAYKGKNCDAKIFQGDYEEGYDYGNGDTQNSNDDMYADYETGVIENSDKKCEDSKDCKELGIVDLDACDFAPWANERCPLTCGKCESTDDFVTKSEENNNCADKEDCTELGIIDLNSCEFAPWANERCPLTCGACTNKSTKKKCKDSNDCQELGIVDETACEFAPWAIERCPLTCGKCRQDVGQDYDAGNYNETVISLDDQSEKECLDSKDCKELGIVDLDSCEFAAWASERCPVTCNNCK